MKKGQEIRHKAKNGLRNVDSLKKAIEDRNLYEVRKNREAIEKEMENLELSIEKGEKASKEREM